MRYSALLLSFFIILNFYQSRYIFLQLIEKSLQTIVLYTIDAHKYIQQQINYSKNINICNETNIKHNYDLSQYVYECPQHQYIIRVIERYPLIIYIEQFLTENEIQHLIEIANPRFEHSAIVKGDGSSSIDSDYRSSSTAYLERGQTPVIKCIEKRMVQFQGDIDLLHLEPLQIVKYSPNEEFKPHFDWFFHSGELSNGGQRISTFFTYLYANCTMGETEFLNIKFDISLHSRFCKFLTCDDDAISHGLRFRPIPGNSIFWFNIDADGQGDNASYHAGRPPGENGTKIGLNAWTRESIYTTTPMTN